MEQRFRRERNISQEAKAAVPAPKKQSQSISSDKSEFSENFFSNYKRFVSHHAWKKAVLLAFAFLVLLGTAGWIIPRVFMLQLDIGRILEIVMPVNNSVVDTNEAVDILILGRGGYGNDAPDLTDSIIVAHYEPGEMPTFTTISIPRDLIISTPLLGRVKINEVYSSTKRFENQEEGFKAIMSVVSDIVGKEIKLYVLMDFAGFKNIIDRIGGIDIEVPERLYDDSYPTANWGYTIVDIPAGLQHFDGDKALKYARSRHTSSDFERSRRQQLVIQALREKLLSAEILTSPRKLEGIYNAVIDSITTNIPLPDMLKLASKARIIEKGSIFGFSLDNSCYETLKYCNPGGLLYTPDRDLFGGASVILPKKATAANVAVYGQIRTFVQMVTGYPFMTQEQPLTIVNASGITGLASSVGIKLKSFGFPVIDEGIKNQTTKAEKSFVRYNSTLTQENNPLLEALSVLFYGDKRPATPEEVLAMTGPYELVLGSDASTYFK